MRSVTRTPMSPARPLSAVPPPTPRAARMPPTTALTMPLRIRLAPSASSQPRTTLVQLVPSSASRLWRSATLSSRTSPALRGADSSLLSVTCCSPPYENQSHALHALKGKSNLGAGPAIDRYVFSSGSYHWTEDTPYRLRCPASSSAAISSRRTSSSTVLAP